MNGRRCFLKLSAVAIALPITVSAEPETDECQFHADNLAQAMKRRHGGNPVVVIDHNAAMAQIVMV